MSQPPAKARKPQQAPNATRPKMGRVRSRRGNLDDHEATRQQILRAAFRLHREQGSVEGISMRALASQVGLSAMGLYGYYENKAALLEAMWAHVLTDALSKTTAAAYKEASARERMVAGIRAFLSYWESDPHAYRLVFASSQTLASGFYSGLTDNAAYQNAVRLGTQLTADFIEEVGGNPERLLEARDLRHALMVGYLHSRLINHRYNWSDLDALRENTVQTIMLGIESLVQRPGVGSRRAPASPA